LAREWTDIGDPGGTWRPQELRLGALEEAGALALLRADDCLYLVEHLAVRVLEA
jgi:hypothetical protein